MSYQTLFGEGVVIRTYILDRAAKGGEAGNAFLRAQKFSSNIGCQFAERYNTITIMAIAIALTDRYFITGDV